MEDYFIVPVFFATEEIRKFFIETLFRNTGFTRCTTYTKNMLHGTIFDFQYIEKEL